MSRHQLWGCGFLLASALTACGGGDADAPAKAPAKPPKVIAKPAPVGVTPATAKSADASTAAQVPAAVPVEPTVVVPVAEDPLAALEERMVAARTLRDDERTRVAEASPEVEAAQLRFERESAAARQAELADADLAAARGRVASAQHAYFQALAALLVEREELAAAARTRGEVALERQVLAGRRRDIEMQLVAAPLDAEALRQERDAIAKRDVAWVVLDRQAETLLKPVEQTMRKDQPTLAEAIRRRLEAEQGVSRAYGASPSAALRAQAEKTWNGIELVIDAAVAGDAPAKAAETEYRRLERELTQATDARDKASAAGAATR